MSEKIKIKIPKVKRKFLKNNLLIVVAAGALALLVGNIFVWSTSQKINDQITELRQKKEKIEQVKEKLEKIHQEKPYLKIEEFTRKVPLRAVPPIAAIQQAGLIIRGSGVRGQIITSEDPSGNGSGSDGQAAAGDAEEFITVGSKSLIRQEFSFKFSSNYEDFMRILEKLSLADPLIVIDGFSIERLDSDAEGDEPIGDVRKLNIELRLATFTEVIPGEPLWLPKKE